MPTSTVAISNSLPYHSMKLIALCRNQRIINPISKLSYPMNTTDTLRFSKTSMPINYYLTTHITTEFP
jgi:hypothetical protein